MPKTYNYRQLKAEKLREKPNFAKSWNTETRESREKRKLNENWNRKFKFVKNNTAFNNSLLQWRLLACLF